MRFQIGQIANVIGYSLMLLLFAAGCSGHLFFGTTDAACINPSFTTSIADAGQTFGNYYVHNNMWNASGYTVTQTLNACGYNSWSVTATCDNSKNDGAVKTYPNVHMDFNNTPLISSFPAITSTFAATAPSHNSGVIYDVAYDIWVNVSANWNFTGSTEFMIWTENCSQTPIGGNTPYRSNVTIGGRMYNIHKNANSNSCISFMPATMTSGTIDLLAIFKYAMDQGWIGSTSTLRQLDFGIEWVSTNGAPLTFSVTDFSINTTTPANVTQKTGFIGGRKTLHRAVEYYAVSGKRIDPDKGLAGAARKGVVVCCGIDEKGITHSGMLIAR